MHKQCNDSHSSKGSPTASSPNRSKRFSPDSKPIEPIDTHVFNICGPTRQVKADHDDKIGQQKYAALEVVALALSIHIAEQEHAKNHRHHVPLRENKVECVG